ncbi:Threonine/homoserine/homoserine lactone efflux protein [Enhydrobacter aerosaccus]|uniref:Threonine/homoserine/homoserine lactone efflux protein n=1 Tax=Enhydrobacter aerosaccus TaxID=225324 RepID=A0A1T4K4F8_9HYPH|nr:LysE family translocator [Enhydrobacter aerosaccus]SJZ37328.1 Threonine/homoserine/homoserine lactone efflux protein [Enhydrobacter aerosaccus]
MEFVPNLLTLAGMHILVAMLPGPNTVVVGWLSATRSRYDGLRAVAGIVLATLIWVVLALWGVGAVLVEAGWLYRSLRLLGAIYLIYVGVRMLRAGWQRKSETPTIEQPRFSSRRPFVTGLFTTLSNPKSAVFWTSAFLVAVPSHAPTWFYVAVIAVIAVQSVLWYGGLALFFSTGFARLQYVRLARRLDVLAGGIMILLGLKLADEVRRELMVRAVS